MMSYNAGPKTRSQISELAQSLIPLRRLMNLAQTSRRKVLSWDHYMFPRAWTTARIKAHQMAIKHRSPADRLMLARGGTPGVKLGPGMTLFVAHVLVSKLLLPKTAALIEREHDQQAFACRRYGKWRKVDGSVVDHCAFLKHYDVVYLMMFYVVSAADDHEGFVLSHVSPLFAPPNRFHSTSTIAFPMGLSKHGSGFLVSYGENDRFSSSFHISRSDLLSLMVPCSVNATNVLLDDERLIDLTSRLTPRSERRSLWREYRHLYGGRRGQGGEMLSHSNDTTSSLHAGEGSDT